MLIRLLQWLTAIIAFGLLSIAGYLLLMPSDAKSGLLVEEPTRVLTNVVPDEEYEIAFRFINRTERGLLIAGIKDT